MKIKYKLLGKSLNLGRGNNYIDIDINNSCFQKLCFLINSQDINTVLFDQKIDNLCFLNLCKSIFYSQKIRLKLIVQNISENKKFILSKVFGLSIEYKKRKLLFNNIYYLLNYKKNKIYFKFDYSFIFITDTFDIKHYKKFNNKFNQYNVEFIYVVNKEYKESLNFDNLKILNFSSISLDNDLRFSISHKKNYGFQNSSGRIVVILHDRIKLSLRWLQGIDKFNYCFDIYTSKIYSRNYRFLDKIARTYSSYIFNKNTHYYMFYNEKNINQYIDGGITVLNRNSFIKTEIFDDRLHWGELEDVDFTARAKIDCNLITFDKNNIIHSDFKNHFKLNNNLVELIYKVIIRRFLRK